MIDELIRSRRTIRRFKPESPGREAVLPLIEAAGWAPSASNKQPFRFYCLDGPEAIARLARAVDEEAAAIAARLEPPAARAFGEYRKYFTVFAGAPLLLAPVWRPVPGLRALVGAGTAVVADELCRRLEREAGLVSAALALENLLLAAAAAGLGAACLTGPLLAESRLRDEFRVPAGWEILALVPLGYPDEQPLPPPRRPAAELMKWIEAKP